VLGNLKLNAKTKKNLFCVSSKGQHMCMQNVRNTEQLLRTWFCADKGKR